MGISSDIAGVLSLIQQQQAIEERKAERDQDLALKLMQIDKMDREYEDSLVATYGPENLIEDVETGRTRVKKLDEGFDMEFSPDFKMKKLLSDLDEEKYLKGVRLSKSIELFDSKVMEREKVASRIRSDYSGLDEKFISGNFATVANTFNNIETGETGAIKSSIEELNKDIAGLNELSSLLAEQELYYKAQESEYAGKTGFVDPGEFYGPDGMLTEYQELYPDRPIAGLEKAYLTGLVQPRIREKAMEEQQDRARAITQQSYQDLKGLLSSEEFDISNYTDDERLQKEFGDLFVPVGAMIIISVVFVSGLAYMFWEIGGKIQQVVLSKVNTKYVRSATLVDLVYAIILYVFKELNSIPMSTTWVFLGLLAGRELAIATALDKTKIKKVFPLLTKDFFKLMLGLTVSTLIVLCIHYL